MLSASTRYDAQPCCALRPASELRHFITHTPRARAFHSEPDKGERGPQPSASARDAPTNIQFVRWARPPVRTNVTTMSAVATIAQPAAPKAAKSADKLRIPTKVRHALDLLASGECKNIKAAAERANISREHLSRMLGRDHVQVFVAQRARKTIAQGVLRASARVIELVDASSEHVSLDASKHVLAIEGIKPVEAGTNISIVNNIAPGYVIDLRDPRDVAVTAHQRDITPKPLITLDVVQGDD